MATLVIDYDGTLHRSMAVYGPAFRVCYQQLVDAGNAPARSFADDEISCWLGYTAQEMWSSFMPELSDDLKLSTSRAIGAEMKRLTDEGKAELFEGTEVALSLLKQQGHTLVFLSNCGNDYMEEHRRAFGLDRFFDAFYCSQDFSGAPKHEIFRNIASQFPERFLEGYVAIGDRSKDIDIARFNGIRSIGCSYGYGAPAELSGADVICADIRDLPLCVTRLLSHT